MKTTKIVAIGSCKCPQCHKGRLFEKQPLLWKKFGKMPKNCSVCGLRYEREPGFFFGAMYISYAISVGVVLATGLGLYWFAHNPEASVYVGVSLGLLVVLYPLIFQLSRSVYIHLLSFVKYDPQFE